MPMNWDFYKAPQGQPNFEPIVQGATVKADAMGQIARNLLGSLQDAQALSERKREFNIEDTRKQALAAAANKHYEAEQTHFKAIEELDKARAAHESAMDAYRMGEPARTQARTDAVAGAYGIPQAVQVGPNLPNALNTQGLNPADIHEIMRSYGQNQDRQQRLQKAQDAATEHQSQVQNAQETFKSALTGGTLNPAEHAAFMGMAQKDPTGALRKFVDYSAKKAEDEHRETYRGDVTSRAVKTANEQEKLGNFDGGKELRAAAASLTHYHGPDLQQKLLELDEKSQGFTLPTGKGTKAEAPKVTTASGTRVEVSPALAKGGTFDELHDNPKAAQELTALARSEAQKDPEYHQAARLAANLSVPVSGESTKEKDSRERAQQEASNKLDQIVAKHGNALAGQLGWKQGEPAVGKSPVQILRDEVTAGKLKDHAALEARAKELGVTLK